MNKTFLTASFLLAIMLSTVVTGMPSAQTAPSTQAGLSEDITPREEATIERTAVDIYRHIVQARADIHRKALDSARRELGNVKRLTDTMRGHLSTAVPKGLILIARKHLEFDPPSQVVRDLPAISSSLARISSYIPVDKALRHIDRAREYLEKDNKKEGEKELALADRSLVSIEVELPLFKAEKFVTAAQSHLAGNEPGKADQALKMAENQARAMYSVIGSPLHQARKKFWQANLAYSEGKMAEARTYLEQGRAYLDKAAKQGRVSQQQAVSTLSVEVSDLEKRIAASSNVATAELKSLWERSKALAERSAEYLAAGIAEEETTLKGEDNLIEAKLHVAYAESYQVTAGEPGKAADELGKADSYLHKALHGELVDKANAAKISELDKEVLSIKANSAEKDSAVQDRYESIKGRLSELIQEL